MFSVFGKTFFIYAKSCLINLSSLSSSKRKWIYHIFFKLSFYGTMTFIQSLVYIYIYRVTVIMLLFISPIHLSFLPLPLSKFATQWYPYCLSRPQPNNTFSMKQHRQIEPSSFIGTHRKNYYIWISSLKIHLFVGKYYSSF